MSTSPLTVYLPLGMAAGLASVAFSTNVSAGDERSHDWAAKSGIELMVDTVGPSCNNANAWLCDPNDPMLSALDSSPTARRCRDLSRARAGGLGVAGSGFQSSTSTMHVQWEGFEDVNSGVIECEIGVERVSYPGRMRLGELCGCSPSFPSPACTCAPSPLTGAPARCQAVTSALHTLISATPRQLPAMWRIASWDPSMSTGEEEDEFSWADTLLGMSTGGQLSACVPAEPFNVGHTAIGAACTDSVDCAPLTDGLMAVSHPNMDHRVLCVAAADVQWIANPPPNFCCAPPVSAERICLPAASALPLPPPPPPPPPLLPESQPINQSKPSVTECSAIEVTLHIHTGSAGLPNSYSHIGWEVDGKLRADPRDCAPELCAGISACGCLYGQNEEERGVMYSHKLCLSPGTHTLDLHDMMGFGWFGVHAPSLFEYRLLYHRMPALRSRAHGAHACHTQPQRPAANDRGCVVVLAQATASLSQEGVHEIRLYDTVTPQGGGAQSGGGYKYATIPTPTTCMDECDLGLTRWESRRQRNLANESDSTAANKCFDRLFDDSPQNELKLCSVLRNTAAANCNCDSCCIETEPHAAAWLAARPSRLHSPPSRLWHRDACSDIQQANNWLCGSARHRLLSFEVLAGRLCTEHPHRGTAATRRLRMSALQPVWWHAPRLGCRERGSKTSRSRTMHLTQ